MNFFQHQDEARRQTTRLVWLFLLAVVLIIAAVDVVVALLTQYMQHGQLRPGQSLFHAADGPTYLAISVVTLLVIGLGTLWRIYQLRSGGVAVALMMGARPVVLTTADANERRLLNVVEEMALASGTPVPTVFVMEDEAAINAFAAGYQPGNAIVAVTRGTLDALTRDELQGVIAHEFSHILNGDMRLNVRLIGVLNGILVIALIGQQLMRASSRGRSRSSKNNGGGIVMVGLALLVIGYVGVFIGRMIKSAVSRQREFLADASAVQFTRNPAGIGGALKKIHDSAAGSQLNNPRAEELSHMYFSQGVRVFFTSLLATHPPLEERIRRIDPSMRLGEVRKSTAPPSSPGLQDLAAMSGLGAVGAVLQNIGQMKAENVAKAQTVREGIIPALQQALRTPIGARAVTYILVLEQDPSSRQLELSSLRQREDPSLMELVSTLGPQIEALGEKHRLPLLELATPALKQMSPIERSTFLDNLQAVVMSDQQLSLREFGVVLRLQAQLGPDAGRAVHITSTPIHSMLKEVILLMAALARAGSDTPLQAEQAFGRGMGKLGFPSTPLPAMKSGDYAALAGALPRLRQLKARRLAEVVQACAEVVLADDHIREEEVELLRLVCGNLNVPVPPLLG